MSSIESTFSPLIGYTNLYGLLSEKAFEKLKLSSLSQESEIEKHKIIEQTFCTDNTLQKNLRKQFKKWSYYLLSEDQKFYFKHVYSREFELVCKIFKSILQKHVFEFIRSDLIRLKVYNPKLLKSIKVLETQMLEIVSRADQGFIDLVCSPFSKRRNTLLEYVKNNNHLISSQFVSNWQERLLQKYQELDNKIEFEFFCKSLEKEQTLFLIEKGLTCLDLQIDVPSILFQLSLPILQEVVEALEEKWIEKIVVQLKNSDKVLHKHYQKLVNSLQNEFIDLVNLKTTWVDQLCNKFRQSILDWENLDLVKVVKLEKALTIDLQFLKKFKSLLGNDQTLFPSLKTLFFGDHKKNPELETAIFKNLKRVSQNPQDWIDSEGCIFHIIEDQYTLFLHENGYNQDEDEAVEAFTAWNILYIEDWIQVGLFDMRYLGDTTKGYKQAQHILISQHIHLIKDWHRLRIYNRHMLKDWLEKLNTHLDKDDKIVSAEA